MKLWLISQTERSEYDTFDSAVVAAETADAARNMQPAADIIGVWDKHDYTWASDPRYVKVEYLGEGSGKARVICASFNAG